MTTPIRREIGQVFIPVRDIHRSADWYGRLLGAEVSLPSHDDTIVDVPMEPGPGLALDANAPFTPDGPPRFFWWADDLGAVVAHLRDLGAELASDVVDIGSVVFVQFRDPDGNLLMVCARTGGRRVRSHRCLTASARRLGSSVLARTTTVAEEIARCRNGVEFRFSN